MPWVLRKEEIQGVLSLEGAERYSHFIKRVGDENHLWSLWLEGWALAADNQGREMIPVWPHSHYAELCAVGAWERYCSKSIPLDVWLDRWIPGMERDHRLIAVFPTPSDKGISVEPRRFERDLREELSKY